MNKFKVVFHVDKQGKVGAMTKIENLIMDIGVENLKFKWQQMVMSSTCL